MSKKYKLVPVEPTQEMIDAGRSQSSFPLGVYKAMLAAAPAVQGEPVAFCEDAALSIAERTFSTEVDEQLASDIIQYAQRLHSLYAAPQPAEQQPDVTLLLELLSHARCNTCDGSGGLYDNHGQPHQCQWCHDRSKALAAHRKGGDV